MDGETNSQLKFNSLKILVNTLTIVMILGMIIIVSIVLKEFFLEPKNKYQKINLPKTIKIPEKSRLESIDLKNNNIRMIVTLVDGTQQLILLTINNGVETSRKYINIQN